MERVQRLVCGQNIHRMQNLGFENKNETTSRVETNCLSELRFESSSMIGC